MRAEGDLKAAIFGVLTSFVNPFFCQDFITNIQPQKILMRLNNKCNLASFGNEKIERKVKKTKCLPTTSKQITFENIYSTNVTVYGRNSLRKEKNVSYCSFVVIVYSAKMYRHRV